MSVIVDGGLGQWRALAAVTGVLAAGGVALAAVTTTRRRARDFDLDWRLAQDEEQIAANGEKIDRAVSLLEAVVPGAPSDA